jgi:cytoskeleton protein RodZ
MASEAGGAIGTRLRAAREKRGLTVLQAAEKLHVDARVLDCLEAEDFGSLDAPVYVRGHLRRYAELVGESQTELQELYSGTERSTGPDLTRIPHRDLDASSSPLALPGLLVLIGLALAGLLWWLLTLPSPKPQPVLTVPAVADAGAGADTDRAVGNAPAGEPRQSSSGSRASAAMSAHATGADARLALRFSAVSWVEVYDATGRRLLQGLSEADSARTLSGEAPLRVVLGNAPGVAVQLNGQPVTLEGLVRRDGSAHFLLDASGHAAPVPPLMAHGD